MSGKSMAEEERMAQINLITFEFRAQSITEVSCSLIKLNSMRQTTLQFELSLTSELMARNQTKNSAN